MTKANFGVVGMAVMGRNLALLNLVAIQLPFITAQQIRQRTSLPLILRKTLCQAMMWSLLSTLSKNHVGLC